MFIRRARTARPLAAKWKSAAFARTKTNQVNEAK